ncbi:ATP-binding protein [Streptomyces sp. NPDC005904]|uniref:ATP-binding protein n=1 Tax=Streptomyces sp. NPDC005904 TaxID=3154570 RepID=UPI0033CB6CD9
MTTTAALPRPDRHRDDCLMKCTVTVGRRPSGEIPSPTDGAQVGLLRHKARARLDDRGLARVADDAVLVVSELVTNAPVHSGNEEITLSLSLRGGRLRIDVHDGVRSYQPIPHAVSDEDEHGRGLDLVGAVAEDWRGDWGVSEGGAVTWCELDLVTR